MARGKELFLDTLRMPRDEILRILTGLNREVEAKTHNRRSERRYTFEGHPIVLMEVLHPGGTEGSYRAISWNISTNGMGLLLGKFVYPECACKVMLRNAAGKLVSLTAMSVHCRHVEGRVHEVGIKFDAPINIADFLPDVGDRNALDAELAGDAETSMEDVEDDDADLDAA